MACKLRDFLKKATVQTKMVAFPVIPSYASSWTGLGNSIDGWYGVSGVIYYGWSDLGVIFRNKHRYVNYAYLEP